MTYDVSIGLKPKQVLPDVFDWLEIRELYFREHWDFSRSPGEYRDLTFKFKNAEHASMFALVWA